MHFLLATFLTAAATPPPLLPDLVGTWEGELAYLDYRSGERFGLPLRAVQRTSADGRTLIAEYAFTDPGRRVHAVSLTTLTDDGHWVESYFREGKTELQTYDLVRAERVDGAWLVVLEMDGTDDDRPARIRRELRLTGDRLTSRKLVDHRDDDAEHWLLRNTSDLKRVGPGPGAASP
jgi:hypothetical protein